jgi:hypothetical protein
MSIPLDRLYHYIESTANKVCDNNIIIYRFKKHGSKNIEDITPLKPAKVPELDTKIEIFCHDQEPLDFYSYQHQINNECWKNGMYSTVENELLGTNSDIATFERPNRNIRMNLYNVHDRAILLHSEKQSSQLDLYKQNYFVPTYYWSHAIIARDWFRYAEHEKFEKKNYNQVKFLIYNRAWQGTREYRLKFLDLLIDYNLVDFCSTSFNPIDSGIHYCSHDFNNNSWKPNNKLEKFFIEKNIPSYFSADYDKNDYQNTNIEIVLETLYDDDRLHLTEKSLRPIALRQPFLLAGTHNSLKYLRSYGFKTFDPIINESYDSLQNNQDRMHAILTEMKRISAWTKLEKQKNFVELEKIAKYNQRHFFSKKFFNIVQNELAENFKKSYQELIQLETGSRFINLRKSMSKDPDLKARLTGVYLTEDERQKIIIPCLKLARSYYNHHNK